MSILQTENVCYSYDGGKTPVLHHMNLEFEKSRTYAIVGKSGTGKTTLLSLLSGLEEPTEGKIFYHNRDMKTLDKYKYRSQNIGVIFQNFNLLPQLSAVENVILSMDVAGRKVPDKKNHALALLQKVSIGESTARRRILKLSGGEQQRVAIARALAYDPDIILADEPTGNLDGETEEAVVRILQDLAHKEEKCVIIVTHSRAISKQVDVIYELAKEL